MGWRMKILEMGKTFNGQLNFKFLHKLVRLKISRRNAPLFCHNSSYCKVIDRWTLLLDVFKLHIFLSLDNAKNYELGKDLMFHWKAQ